MTSQSHRRQALRKELKNLKAAAGGAGDEAVDAPPKPAAPKPAPVTAAPMVAAPLTAPGRPQLALEYLDLAESTGVTLKCAVFHVRRMAKAALLKCNHRARMEPVGRRAVTA